MISEPTILIIFAIAFFIIAVVMILTIRSIQLKIRLFMVLGLAVSTISLFSLVASPKLYLSSAVISQQEAFTFAVANLDAEELNNVVESFEKILQGKLADKSQYVEIWRQLVGLKIAQGKYTQAYKLALRTLELFPKDIELRYLLVRAKLNLSNGVIDRETYDYLIEILRNDPANTKARWLLAIYALQNKDIEKAKKEFQSILLNISDPSKRQEMLEQMQKLIGKNANVIE